MQVEVLLYFGTLDGQDAVVVVVVGSSSSSSSSRSSSSRNTYKFDGLCIVARPQCIDKGHDTNLEALLLPSLSAA